MSTQVIMIIIAVFGVSFLLMIPILIWNKKKKGKVSNFLNDNKQKAVLHLYGNNPYIDGVSLKKSNHIRGNELEYVVALDPGEHTILAKYEASQPSLGKNVNYSTKKPIESIINFNAGNEYTLSIYFYSPDERYNYYKGDVGEAIYSQKLDITGGGIGNFNDGYIICYLESQI